MIKVHNLESYAQELQTKIDNYLNAGEWPPRDIVSQLDETLEKLNAGDEIQLGPNVLLFDTNLRRKCLINRVFKKDAEIIDLLIWKARKGN